MRPTRQIAIGLAFLFGAWGLSNAAAQFVRNPPAQTATNVPVEPAWNPLDFGGPDHRMGGFSFTEGPSQAPDVQAIWRVIWHFEDVAISRPQLLEQTQTFLKQFPNSEHADRARQIEARLKKMIAEDEAHAKIDQADLDKLPVKERVAELIFRLRDQNGYQSMQPGSCDIFADVRKSTNTPAHQLVTIGYPAVPQLMAALDDRTLTRSVTFWRNFRFSHNVLTVGDCALAILQRISGRSFYELRTTGSFYSADGDTAAVHQAVEAWYADLQQLGEKQFLIRQTESGGPSSPAQAKMLLERYPDAAIDPIIKGVQAVRTISTEEARADLQARMMGAATTDGNIRSTISSREAPRKQLLALLARSEVRDERVTAFLARELAEAPDLASRMQAADGLRRRGRPEGVAAMIREWPKLLKERAERGQADFVTTVNFGDLQEFLGGSDSPEAIKALADNLRQEPAQDRFRVIGAIGYIRTNRPSGGKVDQSAATLAAIEESLVTALSDTDTGPGTSVFRNGRSYGDSRICDNAGVYLAERWPDRYQFDFSASYKVRERQRIQCINTWRAAHNQPVLPLPTESTNHVSAAEAAKVTMVEWAPDGVKPAEAFVAKIKALQDQLLTAAAFTTVVRDFEENPQPGTSGLELKALKDEDLTGVKIWVRLLPGTGTGQPRGWSYQKHVTLGQRDLLANSSSGPGTAKFNLLGDLATFAARAIAGPPETPFLIQVTLTANEDSRR
jgi:hypothetical protein